MPCLRQDPPVNQPVRLDHAPENGCLQEMDSAVFKALLQAGRLSANRITRLYPHIDSAETYAKACRDPSGLLALAHLSAAMYTLWDASPDGASCYDGALAGAEPPLDAALRAEAFDWGASRVVAPPDAHLFLVTDAPDGAIVVDASGDQVFCIVGPACSPARAVLDGGGTLPARVRLTALPFRGVLVWDGVYSDLASAQPLTALEKKLLLQKCDAARADGAVITGLEVAMPPQAAPQVDTHDLVAMTDAKLRSFILRRGGKVAGGRDELVLEAERVRTKRAMEKGLYAAASPRAGAFKAEEKEAKKLLAELGGLKKCDTTVQFRRPGCSDGANGDKVIRVLYGSNEHHSFESEEVVPTPAEILRDLVASCADSGMAPRTVAIDEVTTAGWLCDKGFDSGIRFIVRPRPSAEEAAFVAAVPEQTLTAVRGFGAPAAREMPAWAWVTVLAVVAVAVLYYLSK